MIVSKRFSVRLLLILLAFALALAAYHFQPWQYPIKVVGSLRSLGPFAPAMFILLLAVAVLVPPVPDLLIVAGAGITFGPLLGTAYVLTGELLGAVVSFWIARRFGRLAFRRLLGSRRFGQLSRRAANLGWPVLFTLRLLPGVNFSMLSYAAGLTKMSLVGFASATLLGSLPQVVAVTTSGHTLALGDPALLLGIAALMILSALAVQFRRSRQNRPAEEK